jgi:hypothetical protein
MKIYHLATLWKYFARCPPISSASGHAEAGAEEVRWRSKASEVVRGRSYKIVPAGIDLGGVFDLKIHN